MIHFRSFILLAIITAAVQGATTTELSRRNQFKAIPTVDRNAVHIPLWFEPNVGQTNGSALFIARSQNQLVFLQPSVAIVALSDPKGTQSVAMTFKGGAVAAKAEGADLLPSTSNYFLGNDAKKWRTHVPHYGKVRFHNVYPGIDVVYYTTGSTLEYDFLLSPGADPNRIQLSYSGTRNFSIDGEGNIHLALGDREIIQHRPRIYQDVGGHRIEVAGRYHVVANNTVNFALAKYDRSKALVIDPVLDYSTYFGGTAYDTAIALTLDKNGNKYLTGTTASATIPGVPASNNQFQNQLRGATNAFIARFDKSSGAVTYFTYLGGANSIITGPTGGISTGRAIAIDNNGAIYIAVDTNANDFPVQANNSPRNQYAGGSSDAFVTKISAAGDQLIYTKFVGGGSDDFVGGGRGCGTGDAPDCLVPGRADEFGSGLAVDSHGFAYITGFTRSSDFPLQPSFARKQQKSGEAVFVSEITQDGSDFVFSTVIEGSAKDGGEGIALDASNNIYLTGYTTSPDFPTTPSAYQRTFTGTAGLEDAFVLKMDANSKALVYSTYLGGNDRDLGFRITLDSTNNAYITGYTRSLNFPTTLQSAQPNYGGGNSDAFVTKLSSDGRVLLYSTYLGGTGDDWGFADIRVDTNGNALVGGYTTSRDLKTVNAFQPQFGAGDTHGYIAELNSTGSAWIFLTYYGGSKHDEIHSLACTPIGLAAAPMTCDGTQVSIAGFTSSQDLPKATNTFVGNQDIGRYDAFIAQVSQLGTVSAVLVPSPASLPSFVVVAGGSPVSQNITIGSSGGPLQFTATTSAPWITVSPSSGTTGSVLTVTVDPRLIPPGTSSGTVTIASAASSLTLNVLVGFSAVPVITSISPSTLSVGAADTSITITGSGFTSASTVSLNGAAAPTQFVNSGTLTATVPRALLANAGTISVAVVTGTSSSAPSFLTVATGVPVISSANVLNGATNLPGPVSPGEIITIKGTGFGPTTLTQAAIDPSTGGIATTLAATRVIINGTPAPLVYSTQNQVAAIVPYSVTTGPASIQVEYQGQRSAPANVDVALAVPGIFTLDSTGRGAAVVYNQDGTLNSPSNPAPRGSIVTFFGTGEGLTNPAGVTGSLADPNNPPKPVQNVAVKINGLDAPIVYVGAVPNLVEGLLQVNARVPDNAPSGSAIPLVLQVGGISSPLNVTLSVQ